MLRIFEITLTVAMDDYSDTGDPAFTPLDAMLMELEDIAELQVIGFDEKEKVLTDKYDYTPPTETEPIKYATEPASISDAFLDLPEQQIDQIKDATTE